MEEEHGAEHDRFFLFYVYFIGLSYLQVPEKKMKEHRTKELTLFTFPPTSYQGVKGIYSRICESERLFMGI